MSPGPGDGGRGEDGSVSVVVVVLVAGLMLVAAGLAATGRVVAAHVQVTTAADAAALAAAPLTFLAGDPELEARRFARANGARLVACTCPVDTTVVSRTVTVQVAAHVRLPLLGVRTVRARAAAEFDPATLLGA